MKKPPSILLIAVAQRLRAVQAELGLTEEKMGALVGTSRSAWSNWVSAGNMPEEEAMLRLCEVADLNMDWIYRGRPDHMPAKLAIRLEARLLGLDPDAASAGQMAPVLARFSA